MTHSFLFSKHDWQMALIITRREVRDAFRDWRLLVPIILLTIGFPGLMNFTAQRLLNFVEGFGATVVAEQLIPFLLLVVGFFPISFSLIIALETFVGEKERKSMEPLLATPLTNTQLYVGKMLASLVPPIFASYLGMGVYLLGLWSSIGWTPTPMLFAQTIALTTIQGVIMVAAAVVVSSQTTSVRAANLLASFIIVPMALLIQAEAAALFWGNHVGLWWLVLALFITALVLIRMGIHIFNREELIGRDIDQIKLGWMWARFWERYSGRSDNGYPKPFAWYRQTVRIVPTLKYPALALLVGFAGTVLLASYLGRIYQVPEDIINTYVSPERMMDGLETVQVFAEGLPRIIFTQNIRVILLSGLLGVFTFGVLGVFIFMLPWGIIAYAALQLSFAGLSGTDFILSAILPHAVIEFPALLLAASASLKWHTTVIAPPPDKVLSEAFLHAMGDFFRVFIGLVLPMLLLGAYVEAYFTPQVIAWMYGA